MIGEMLAGAIADDMKAVERVLMREPFQEFTDHELKAALLADIERAREVLLAINPPLNEKNIGKEKLRYAKIASLGDRIIQLAHAREGREP